MVIGFMLPSRRKRRYPTAQNAIVCTQKVSILNILHDRGATLRNNGGYARNKGVLISQSGITNVMENLSGQVIKSYELIEQIGMGGFGEVYRAIQSSVSREVAIK